jgi:hypothetical protein
MSMTRSADFPGDVNVSGALTARSFSPPAGSVGNFALTGGAGSYIDSAKIQRLLDKEYAQDSTTVATVERRVLHTVKGATGALVEFGVGSVSIAIGAAAVVVDLLKNGSTILSATITLDNANTAYVLETQTFSSSALVAGDVLELKVTSAVAGGGTLPKGLFARLTLTEDPA